MELKTKMKRSAKNEKMEKKEKMTHVYVAHLRRGSKIRCVSGQSMTVHKDVQ